MKVREIPLRGVAFLLLAFAFPAVAQTDAEAPQRAQLRAMLLAGAHGLGSDAHRYVGIETGVLRSRVGVMAMGQLGSGDDHHSTLLAAGPAVTVVGRGYVSMVAYGGAGRYGEEAASKARRSTGILFAGLSLRVPLAFGALGATASLWRGNLEGEPIEVPFTIQSHRFSVGFGF